MREARGARRGEAVREGAGDTSAQLIEHLKKPEMAKEAERLLAGTGWLPEPLRTPDLDSNASDVEVETLPAFLADDEDDAGAQMAAAE